MKDLLANLIARARHLVAALTCHHCLYGLTSVVYGAGALHLMDKDLVSQLLMTVYFALALQG